MKKGENLYDLEERTAKFGEFVIKFCYSLKLDSIKAPIINQLIRSSTSVGANYMEANGASAKMTFEIKYIYVKKKQWKQNIG